MTDFRIVGIGVDIEQIDRFTNKPFSENEKFYRKLFTEREIEYCKSKRDPYPHFTARFCAKEALAKALPGSIRPGWKEVEILTEKSGRPFFEIIVKDINKKSQLNDLEILLSLSHDRTKAVAYVIVQSR